MNNIRSYIVQFCLLAFLMIGSFGQVSALDLPQFRIINAGLGKQFALSIGDIPQAQAEFSVRNQAGGLVLSTTIEGFTFQRLFDLKDLKEGNYTFTLETQSSKIIQPVRLTKRAILYHLDERKVVYMPTLSLDQRQVTVHFSNTDQANCLLQIRTEENELLYETQLGEGKILEKRINLVNLPAATYSFVVEGTDYRWQQAIVLN